jgi:hypothetical protein
MAQRNSSRTKQVSPRLPGSEGIHRDDGVDLTLIRWMLSLTPAERLQVLQQAVRSLQRLRND